MVVGEKGFVEFVVALYTAWVTELEASNLGSPRRYSSVSKELIIWNVEPKSAMVTGKIIKIKVSTLTDVQ